MTLSGATTPGWSGPGSNGNEGGIQHSSKLQDLIHAKFFVISRTLVEGGASYRSAEMLSVYSTTPADWTV